MRKYFFLIHLIAFVSLPVMVHAGERAVPEDYSTAIKIELLKEDPDKRYAGQLYCLDYDELIGSGLLSSTVDPRTIKLYNQATEIKIYIEGEEDGKFNTNDKLFFYGKVHTQTTYTYQNVFWLVWGKDKGARVSAQNVDTNVAINTVYRKFHFERNEQYISDFTAPDPWYFKSYVYADPRSYPSRANKSYVFNLSNVDADSTDDALISVKFSAYRWQDSWLERDMIFSVNNIDVGTIQWIKTGEYIFNGVIPQAVLVNGVNRLNIKYSQASCDYFALLYLDNVVVTYPGTMELSGGDIYFENHDNANRSIMISDVTASPVAFALNERDEMQKIDSLSVTGTNAIIKANVAHGNRYIVSTADKAKENADNDLELKKVSFSDLRSGLNQADYIVVYWSQDILSSSQSSYVNDMVEEINRLLEYRKNQGLNVKAVPLNHIYNEFSAGIANPQGLKDFFSYAYNNWKDPNPSYLVLIGDATYDFRQDELYDRMGFDYERSGSESYKQVPTYMFRNEDIINNTGVGYTATDDWLVCFDGPQDLFPEITVGRLPARTAEDLKIMIDKIITFENTDINSEHLKRINLISGGMYDFERTSSLIEGMAQGYTVKSLSPAGYLGTNFNQDLRANLSEGSLFVNYSGHGSWDLWGVAWDVANYGFDFFSSIIFENSDVDDLTNKDKYQIYSALSCMNGYLLKPTVGDEALAEALMKEKDKGAVAVFASSGVSLPTYQRYMAEGFYEAIFKKNYRTLGAAAVRAKLYLTHKVEDFAFNAAQSFMLYGDPALQIPLAIIAEDVEPEEQPEQEQKKGSDGPAKDESKETKTIWDGERKEEEERDKEVESHSPRPPVPPEGFGPVPDPFGDVLETTSDVSYSAYLFDTALASGEETFEIASNVTSQPGAYSSQSLVKQQAQKEILREVRIDEQKSRTQVFKRSENKKMNIAKKFFSRRKEKILKIEQKRIKDDVKIGFWKKLKNAIISFLRSLVKFIRGLF